MDYIAIDFETANEKRCSPCALGIAVVADGRLVENRSWLIRPPDARFNFFNVSIHGISQRDVLGEPEFDELWPTFSRYLEGKTVVAHNAGFDLSVLRGTLDFYGLPYPELHYACTITIARRAWPGLPGYSLGKVAEHLGIDFTHHRAADDAAACAGIVQHANRTIKGFSLNDFARRLGSPFYGKGVAFTGTLRTLTRPEAKQKVIEAGGAASSRVTMDTAFLVTGRPNRRYTNGGKSAKLRQAEALIARGQEIQILTEESLLELLNSGSLAAVAVED
jgi:DNA polymerase III subunit epsilon